MANLEQTLVMMGRLSHQAAFADLYAVNAFRLVVGLDIKMARAIFFAAEAWPMRQQLLKRAAEARLDAAGQALVAAFTTAARDVSGPRNDMAHVLLAQGAVGEMSKINLKHIDNHTVRITEGYLKELMDRSSAKLAETTQRYGELCANLGAKLELELG